MIIYGQDNLPRLALSTVFNFALASSKRMIEHSLPVVGIIFSTYHVIFYDNQESGKTIDFLSTEIYFIGNT